MKARPIMFTNWTVKEIEKKYSNMDLIIDLTNTHKYYDPAELPNSMKHVKIKSKGGGPVPDSKVVQKFYQAVDETLSKKKGKFLICITQTSGLYQYIVHNGAKVFLKSHLRLFIRNISWNANEIDFHPILYSLENVVLQSLISWGSFIWHGLQHFLINWEVYLLMFSFKVLYVFPRIRLDFIHILQGKKILEYFDVSTKLHT